MGSLPAELVVYLCSFLDGATLKSFRLLCKAFADVAGEYLFHDFEFRLYPDKRRLYQLEQLAFSKAMAPRLKCLSFESGVQLEYADYRYWQAQVYHTLSSAWSRSIASKGSTKDEYATFHESLQARFPPDLSTRYDLYRWHLDQQAASMADRFTRDSLIRILNALNQSTRGLTFKLVMAEPQIRLEDLEAFAPQDYAFEIPYSPDRRRMVMSRRSNCIAHFNNFLEAAEMSQCQLTNLTAIDIPPELMAMTQYQRRLILEDVLGGLKSLQLTIGSFPHSDVLSRADSWETYVNGRNQWARKLGNSLNRARQLEHLTLVLPTDRGVEYAFELFDRTNLDRFPRLWVPNLKTFALGRFQCRWGDLKALLDEGAHIQTLALRECRLETGSMLDLLAYMEKRRFPQVSILGTWYVDEDAGSWHWHTEEDFTDCVAATSYEGPYAHKGMKTKLEKFLHSGGDCPLPHWNAANKTEAVWEISGDTSFHYLPGPPPQ